MPGFRIKKVIAGHGSINPKQFTPEEYARIKQMANPRRGVVSQLSGNPSSKKLRTAIIRTKLMLSGRPQSFHDSKPGIKLHKRLEKLMAKQKS
jgi:hypothetical protein